MELNSLIELFCGYFLWDDFLDSGEDIWEAVGEIVNDDALELGVFEDLDKGVWANEAQSAGDEKSFELWHKVWVKIIFDWI